MTSFSGQSAVSPSSVIDALGEAALADILACDIGGGGGDLPARWDRHPAATPAIASTTNAQARREGIFMALLSPTCPHPARSDSGIDQQAIPGPAAPAAPNWCPPDAQPGLQRPFRSISAVP